MSCELDKLEFTLTGKMTYIMIQINNLSNEKKMIESQLKLYKNTIHYHHLKNSIQIIDKKIKRLKQDFIKQFRVVNKKSIEEYWKIRSKR